jgi:hypothetical protein
MAVIRVRASLAAVLAVAPVALLLVACSRPPEQQFLNQFFRAARVRDNNTLAMMSAVEFDPREQGEVSSFDITNISEERRTPLDFKSLIEAERQAQAALDDFRKKRIEYESANRSALEAIAKLERDKGKLTAAQQAMKDVWDKWRADAAGMQKAAASAKAALSAQTGPAEASLTQPGQPAFAADKFTGDLVTKDVTITADVRMPDGQTSQKQLVVTILRVEGTLDGTQRTGRPIISRIQGA